MHYIHVLQMSCMCESKIASILNLIVGSSVGNPLNCPLFPYLKVVGYPLSCPLSCPLYPYMAVVGCLICMAKFPWAAHGQPTPLPTELPTFFIFGSSGLPTELPPVSIYGGSGQPNLHGKNPMGSPLRCPLCCPFFIFGSSWLPTELPTELHTVSIYGSSGQPNFHGKIPMGSPQAAHSVAHVQPIGSEVGSSPVFFFVWDSFRLYRSNCSLIMA